MTVVETEAGAFIGTFLNKLLLPLPFVLDLVAAFGLCLVLYDLVALAFFLAGFSSSSSFKSL